MELWRTQITMTRRPVSVTITFILLLCSASFWIGFGMSIALGLHPAIPDNEILRWAMVILAIITGVALAGSVFLLARHSKIAYYFVVVLLGLIAVLSITDEVGTLDVVVLLVTLVTFLLLIINKRWFLVHS